MTLFDLVFLASVVFVCISLIAMVVAAIRFRRDKLRRWATILISYLAFYTIALISTSLALPRRIYSPGERRCWDDWCTTAVRATQIDLQLAPSAGPCSPSQNPRLWYVEIELSSVAKRIRQRAPDAHAELEDANGTRYSPCAGPLAQGSAPGHALTDPLDPDQAFSVVLPFQLPANRQPVGIVMHHGSFPGVIIIADDSAFLHRPALQRLTTNSQTEVALLQEELSLRAARSSFDDSRQPVAIRTHPGLCSLIALASKSGCFRKMTQ